MARVPSRHTPRLDRSATCVEVDNKLHDLFVPLVCYAMKDIIILFKGYVDDVKATQYTRHFELLSSLFFVTYSPNGVTLDSKLRDTKKV